MRLKDLYSGWYVLYTKSRFEKKVKDSLKDISVETFLPQVKVVRRWSDRKKTILKPLFPSYVFVNIKSSLELHKALLVDGAINYIRFGTEYAKITEKEIQDIKLLVGDTHISDIKIHAKHPKVGEKKIITRGPLSGLVCEIVRANNIHKIVVNIESLRQIITATVPLYFLEE